MKENHQQTLSETITREKINLIANNNDCAKEQEAMRMSVEMEMEIAALKLQVEKNNRIIEENNRIIEEKKKIIKENNRIIEEKKKRIEENKNKDNTQIMIVIIFFSILFSFYLIYLRFQF